MILLGVTAGGQAIQAMFRLAGVSNAGIIILTLLPQVALVVVFLVWFYRIRQNAGLWAPQRRSQGWAIGAWFTPIVFLWFPVQIVIDAFRASTAGPAGWSPVPRLVSAWWTCWILAWFSGFHTSHTTIVGPNGYLVQSTRLSFFFGSTVVSNVFSAAAAVLLLLVVQRLTQLQTARIGR